MGAAEQLELELDAPLRRRLNVAADLTGERFGCLTAIRRSGTKRYFTNDGKCLSAAALWLCRCDCGVECVANAKSLRNGRTRSCGHLRGIINSELQRQHISEHHAYKWIRNRAARKELPLQPEWRTFEGFLADVGARPSNAHVLCLIKQDIGYIRGNARWLTRDERDAIRLAIKRPAANDNEGNGDFMGPPAPKLRMPMFRSECVDEPRPCPHIQCRHHLAVDAAGSGQIRIDPHGELDMRMLRHTCSLDVADRGESTLDEIVPLMGMSRARVQQVERAASMKLEKRVRSALGENP